MAMIGSGFGTFACAASQLQADFENSLYRQQARGVFGLRAITRPSYSDLFEIGYQSPKTFVKELQAEVDQWLPKLN